MDKNTFTVEITKRKSNRKLCSLKEIFNELKDKVEIELLKRGYGISTPIGFISAKNLSLKGVTPYLVTYIIKKESIKNGSD